MTSGTSQPTSSLFASSDAERIVRRSDSNSARESQRGNTFGLRRIDPVRHDLLDVALAAAPPKERLEAGEVRVAPGLVEVALTEEAADVRGGDVADKDITGVVKETIEDSAVEAERVGGAVRLRFVESRHGLGEPRRRCSRIESPLGVVDL